MAEPVLFVIWCRWGLLPLFATDEDSAIDEATRYAVSRGLTVLVAEAGEGGREIVVIPPAPQTFMIPALLFDGLEPRPGLVALN
jgi:hypothetical protein